MADCLILHAGALGDLVLTIQLALQLEPFCRSARIDVVSRTDPGDLADCMPSVRRRSGEGIGLHWLYTASADPPPDELRRIAAGRTVLSALGGVGSLVHRRIASLRPDCVYSFDARPRPGLAAHITSQWAAELDSQGARFTRRPPAPAALAVPANIRRRGLAVLRDLGCHERIVLIHPGSGGRDKCWPLQNFLEVGRLGRAADAPVCFVTGPVEAERWPRQQIDQIRAEFPLLALAEPGALVAALASANVLVANDTGPAHLAALLGTATVTIFGPSSPRIWQPLNARGEVVAGDPDGSAEDWGISPSAVNTLLQRYLEHLTKPRVEQASLPARRGHGGPFHRF